MIKKKFNYKLKSLILLIILCLGLFTVKATSNLFSTNNFSTLKENAIQLTNVVIISDDETGWNNDWSYGSSISVDNIGNIHIVWWDETNGPWGTDMEIMYATSSDGITWSNITIISDDETRWNNGSSLHPKIDIDPDGNIHVVWRDNTEGIWGGGLLHDEIMYCNFTQGIGWSNATVISDDDTGWNTGISECPDLDIDQNGKIHVVWQDGTGGSWGSDIEILYTSSSNGFTWSDVSCVSKGDSSNWNNDWSFDPSISVDNIGNIHVVWQDHTDGIWGTDSEIMYATSSDGITWSNATVISDDETKWNKGSSYVPSISTGPSGDIHVVWSDHTDGPWGTLSEIMYATSSDGIIWSNATVISNYESGWNTGVSGGSSIFVDNIGTIHVCFNDHADGPWGTDCEIMYIYSSDGINWANFNAISDDIPNWNLRDSGGASFTVDINNNIHFVWNDETVGDWGGGDSDPEIMYRYLSFLDAPKVFILNSNVDDPDTDGNFQLSWEESIGADNYTLYQSSELITIIDGSQTIIAEEIETLSYNLNGYTNGTYYFIIKAKNNFGSILSNCNAITIEIPPSIEEEPTISFGFIWLFFSIISMIGLCFYVKKKI